MACTITYKDQIFNTPEELLTYAQQNNIQELLSVFNGDQSNNVYYQLPENELQYLKSISEQFDTDITEFNQYVLRSNQADIKEVKGTPLSQTEQDYLDNSKFSKGYVFELGRPSSILQSVGMPNLPIKLGAQWFKDHILNDPNHNLKTLNFKGLVEAIHDPIAIWQDINYRGQDGRIEMATTIKGRDGRNVNVVIQFNREFIHEQESLNVNAIVTAFETDVSKRFENSVIDGNIEYIDKKRITNYLQGFRHFSEIVYPKHISDSSTKIQKVLYKIQNFPDKLSNEQKYKQKIIASGGENQVVEPTKANPVTLKRLHEYLQRIGINVRGFDNLIDSQGVKIDANGLADITNKLIQYVNGKEETVLPEEAMHFAVEIIKQKDSSLYKLMLNRIGSYKYYKDIFSAYSTDPNYQKDGKPDVPKIKQEIIGKMLAEHIVNKSNEIGDGEQIVQVQTWWQKIITALKRIFNKAGYNPFEEAAIGILTGNENTNTEGVDFENSGSFLQLSDKKEFTGDEQKQLLDNQFNKIVDTHKKLSKVSDGSGNSFYEIGGNRVKRRVTDITKLFYERLFGDKEITKSEFQKGLDDLKKEQGTKGHLDFEDIFHRYIDDDGYLKKQPDPQTNVSNIDPNDNSKYLKLENYFSKMIFQYPAGTRFLSEVQVYDPQKDEAGTLDFMAIVPDPKEGYRVDIRDWKFMDLSDKTEDVPWYKQEAFNKQIGEYKRILKTVYGVKQEQFRQTRAIPILTSYGWNDPKTHDKLVLKDITIGDANVRNIEDTRLLPVATKDERTGNPVIDKLIDKLNQIYKVVSNTSVKEHRKDIKAEQLNVLFKAIRQLQIKQNIEPLLEVAKVQIQTINNLLGKYSKTAIEEISPDDLTNDEISQVEIELLNANDFMDTYSRLDTDLSSIIDDADLLEDVRNVAFRARMLEQSIKDARDRFSDKFVANKRGVTDILDAERVVQMVGRQFKYLSQSETATMRVLWRMNEEVEQRVALETDEQNKKIIDIKEKYTAWAKNKGLSPKQYFNILKKKDSSGRVQHELLDVINSRFYTAFKEAKQKGNITWYEDNIDWDEYDQFKKDFLKRKFNEIDQNVYLGSDDEIEKRKIYEKKKLTDELDTYGNKYMRNFPLKEIWYSDEYRELLKPENAPALEFFNFIMETNKIGKESGYLSARQARTFLPFLRKDLVDQLVFDGKVGLGEAFINSISINANDVGYAKHNPLTGEIERSIPKYFTTNIGQPIYDADGNLDYIDYSNVSDNLFVSMSAYKQQLIRYQYLTSLEGQVKALLSIEKNKKSIATSRWGNIQWENGEPKKINSNKENYELLEKFVNAIIYGEKYSGQTTDVSLGKVRNTFANKLNSKFGENIFPNDGDEREISLVKTADSVNRWFAMKTLGLSIPVSISQFLGGNFQAMINAGSWFDSKDFIKSEMELMANKLNGKTGQIRAALKEYFVPLSEDLTIKQKNEMGIKPLEKFSMSNSLMVMMRYADKAVEYSIFFAMMKNTMVEDGKLVNIRKFVKSQEKYANRYNLSAQERRQIEKEGEEQIKQLQETRSLEKISTLDKDGNLTIPGIDRKSETVFNYRSLIQQISKAATGNISGNDMNGIRMTVIGRSFMMFKNWIPRLVYNRLGHLEHVEGVDEYQWGRVRMLFQVLSSGVIKSGKSLTNIMKANEKGVESLRQLYEQQKQKYKERTGKDLNMTESEFFDLVRNNLRGQMKDFIFYLSLMGMFLAAKALPPDDQEDPSVKSHYKFYVRVLDKVSDEMSFYYNPIAFQQILNGSVFPALGAITDAVRLVEHIGQFGFGLVLQNDKWIETAHVPKYMMKTFPITKELLNYLAFFFPELAKEMGVTISSQSRLR